MPRTVAVGCAPPTSEISDATAAERDQVLALGRVALGLHDQLDSALEPRRRRQHSRRQAEDRADVDVLSRPRRGPRPVVAPPRQSAEHGDQLTRPLGQFVVHARRYLAVALAGEQAVGHHAVQPRAQLFRRDARKHALQLDEPARASGKITDDEQRPLVAHEIERAGVRRPLIVWVTFGRWDRWYERPPWCGLGCRQNTRFNDGRLLVSTILADDRDVNTSASSRPLARYMAATGASCSRVWGTTRD